MQEATFTSTTTTSRRTLFGAASAMILRAAPAAGAAKARELDGELLAACAHYQAVEAEHQRLSRASDGDTPEHKAAEAALNATADDYDEAMLTISRIPARTPEGLQAKAEAIIAFHEHSARIYGQEYTHERLEWSLIVDVAGRGRA